MADVDPSRIRGHHAIPKEFKNGITFLYYALERIFALQLPEATDTQRKNFFLGWNFRDSNNPAAGTEFVMTLPCAFPLFLFHNIFEYFSGERIETFQGMRFECYNPDITVLNDETWTQAYRMRILFITNFLQESQNARSPLRTLPVPDHPTDADLIKMGRILSVKIHTLPAADKQVITWAATVMQQMIHSGLDLEVSVGSTYYFLDIYGWPMPIHYYQILKLLAINARFPKQPYSESRSLIYHDRNRVVIRLFFFKEAATTIKHYDIGNGTQLTGPQVTEVPIVDDELPYAAPQRRKYDTITTTRFVITDPSPQVPKLVTKPM